MTHDILHRFIFENDPVRGEYIKLQDSLHTILKQHDYPPAVARLLGEALTIAALLSAIIKFKGRLTVQFRGKGKLRLLLAQCDDQNQIRGLAKYDEGVTTYEELIAAFHDGVLVIMIDTGSNGQRYQGVVEWKGDSLAESIEHYFDRSEQLATKIKLAVNEEAAIGFLLQVVPMPDTTSIGIQNEIIMPSWQRISKLTEAADDSVLRVIDYPDLLTHLYPEETIRIFDGSPVTFHCGCTRKRGQDAIYVLGRVEAEEELRDKQTIVVTCDFCNQEYVFDRVDVEEIFRLHDQPPPDTHLH